MIFDKYLNSIEPHSLFERVLTKVHVKNPSGLEIPIVMMKIITLIVIMMEAIAVPIPDINIVRNVNAKKRTKLNTIIVQSHFMLVIEIVMMKTTLKNVTLMVVIAVQIPNICTARFVNARRTLLLLTKSLYNKFPY